MRARGLVLLCGLLLALAGASSAALQLDLAPRELFEFAETITPGTSFEFIFRALHADPPDVRVLDERRETIQAWAGAREGRLRFDPRPITRTIRVIFDNRASLLTARRVVFHFRESLQAARGFDGAQLDPIEAAVEATARTVDGMFEHQVALRAQQREHRATIAASNRRLLLWAAGQVLTLLLLSFAQIYFLKRFLERKTFI